MATWSIVKSVPGLEISSTGIVRNRVTGRILEPHPNPSTGALRVYFNGKKYYVHRLMADAFFDSDGSCSVRHIDNDVLNNNLDNLKLINDFKNAPLREFNVKAVLCKHCKHRNEYAYCYDRPDDFYCADGEL